MSDNFLDKKRPISVSSDEEEEVIVIPDKRKKTKNQKKPSNTDEDPTKKSSTYDLDLSDQPPHHKIESYKIHIGEGFQLENREFRKIMYLNLSRIIDGDVKNRFNLPITLLDTLKKAIECMQQYLKQ